MEVELLQSDRVYYFLCELQFFLGVRSQKLGVDSIECIKQQYTVKQKKKIQALTHKPTN
jgi:hypothetical protein